MSVDTSSATPRAGIDPSRVRIAGAIKQAASTTGTSFEYLLTTAKMESDFNPKAGASTTSARGLFQFIEQTWLGTVKEAGAQLGYGKYADAISKSSSGSYSVSDPSARTAIMKLRDDPAASSSMAAVLAQSNSFKLTGKLGRRPTDGELYMAHFMGVGGAAKLISNAEDNPQASGARLFPNAAAANRSIFFDRSTGRARSVSEVYSVLSARYAGAANSPATRSAMAAVGDIQPTMALASAAPAAAPAIDNAAYLSTFPDVRAITPVTMASASSATDTPPRTDPIFRSLFQAGNRTQPVSPAVQELWGNSSSLTSVASATTSQAPNVRAPQPLDLFSDRNGTFSS
ncbi:MAG TPA: transglycosylase SLT domain-containing protein [Bradyrhizobium sp.]|jgi:Transglycosylase SLT domain|nr:transglycosylase SLT domain-containing protein [Bradyrhizobium sp.]